MSDSASMESILLHIHATLDNRENLKWHRRSMVVGSTARYNTMNDECTVQYTPILSHAALELENLDPERKIIN